MGARSKLRSTRGLCSMVFFDSTLLNSENYLKTKKSFNNVILMNFTGELERLRRGSGRR